MDPKIWGPGAWLFLHSVTLNYPNSPTQIDKKIYSDFFNLVGKVLPCSACKNHYDTNNNTPLMIENTDEYSNSENNKPPTYNNTIQMISIENLNTIKNQINQQSKIIDDLKTVLENQKKICNN